MITQPDPLPDELRDERLTRVSEALGPGDVMVLPGAPHRLRSRDTEYPHRPDSELYWLTGLTEPDAVVVVRGGEEPVPALFLHPRDPDAELWAGARPDPQEAGRALGAAAVHPLAGLRDELPGILDGADTVYFRLGAHPTVEPAVVEALRRARRRGPRRGTGPRGVVDPGEILDELRLRKDPWEVAQIRRAVAVTLQAFREMAGALRPGVPEWELQAVLEAGFRRLGSAGPAYETIVGTGANACTLHYVRNDRLAGPGEMVLVDAGATWGLYAADVTRTWPVDGTWTPDQRELVGVVDAARSAAVGRVAPGVTVAEVHDAAVRVLTEGLVALGVLSGSVETLLEEEAHRPFFPHQTSHWLGLDVHDPGDYARGGRSRVLEPGMVLTVEPGLYLPGGAVEGHPGAAPFRDMGVRLEDDILVTPDGYENLTAALETAPASVEAALEAARERRTGTSEDGARERGP